MRAMQKLCEAEGGSHGSHNTAMIINWHAMRDVGAFVIEVDAITAAIIGEALQSHAREIARKRELFEAQRKTTGSIHAIHLCNAEQELLAEFGRTVQNSMMREMSVQESRQGKDELFAVVAPRKEASHGA